MSGRIVRNSGILAAITTLALILAGCGGGGSATSTGDTSSVGPAAVEISFSVAPATGSAAVPVTVAGPSTVPTPDPAYKWPGEIQEPSPQIAHVYMDVLRISLMPASEAFGGGDMDGEMGSNSPNPPSPPDNPHFVTIVPDARIRVDLLQLENGKKLARFFNRFDRIPAGTYDKIRVYYDNVVVVLDDAAKTKVRFHPTAHSKFDIHFRQGYEFVVPVSTDTTQPDGSLRFFRVQIDVVGLKLTITNGAKDWNRAKVILRPQIFAKFVPEILYGVAGTADNVIFTPPPVSGNFKVLFGTEPRIVPVAFDNDTTWAYSDNVLGRSPWVVENVPNTTAVTAFRDTAKVMAIGPFDPSRTLRASDIVFSFPVVKEGIADNVWIPPDNVAFVVRSNGDNVLVFPKPDRHTAYYDNAAAPHAPLNQSFIDNGVGIKARGYNGSGGVEAYWISIGP